MEILEDEPQFLGVFSHDQLPDGDLKKGDSLIINYNNHNEPGSHWVCIYGPNEFYDSFGIVPSDVIQDWMRKSAKLKQGEIKFNSQQIQDNTSVMCGPYCVHYIQQRNKGKAQYDVLHDTFGFDTQANEETINNYNKNVG